MNKMKSVVRKGVRSFVLSVLGTFKRPAPYVYILNGHMVDWHHDNDADGVRFRIQLEALHKYCDFVNFEDAVRMIVNKEQVKRPTVAFSFDDGWRDCYTQIVPQLEKFGVTAMFFVNPNFADEATAEGNAFAVSFKPSLTPTLASALAPVVLIKVSL